MYFSFAAYKVLYRPTVVTAHRRVDRFRRYGLALVLSASNCTQAPELAPGALQGNYYSSEDGGVLVFRSDGTFGYAFASHAAFLFADEEHLPSNRGRYVLLADGHLELSGISGTESPFTLQVSKDKRTIILTRAVREPENSGGIHVAEGFGLPAKAKYTKKGADES